MPETAPINPPAPEFRPDRTFRVLIHTFGLHRRVMEPFFAQFGISGSQWGVLRALHRAEQEKLQWLRLTDLGNRLIVRPPSITGVVDRLQRMGLLERTSLPDDRRAKRVSLTTRGREKVNEVLAALPGHTNSIVDVLPPADRERLQNLLEILGGRLQTLADRHETANKDKLD
jgi:DNA-binding MarR family transcriptional regulator